MNKRSSTKIAFIMDEYVGPTAGTEKQLQHLICGLSDTEFWPELFAMRESPYLKRATDLCPVHILDIPKLMSTNALRKGFRLAVWLRNNHFKISHIFFPDASIFAPFFCKIGGTKVIVSRRDQGFLYSPQQIRLLKLFDHFVDSIIANSEAVRKSIGEKIGGRSYNKTVVIYNGCDFAGFNENGASSTRDQLRIPSRCPIVGMVANLNPWKRHGDALRAFARVKQACPDTHLVLVGEGPERSKLEELVLSLNLDGSVHFLGERNDVHAILKECSVCILCSETEGLSNALIEYMMAGKPVVATNVGGNSEIVKEGVTGFLVPLGDTTLLAQRIIDLLSDTETANKMGIEGRKAAETKFGMSRMVDEHIFLYKRLL